jgi:DNA-binding NarL/FixJ family response regulator
MRVVIVGPASARARLRLVLPPEIEVAGEARTLSEARASGLAADAWVITPPAADDAALPPLETLTDRELDVVELLAQGLSNKAIAARLGISDQTVKFHVASIYGKLGATNRTDAARRALKAGVIPM